MGEIIRKKKNTEDDGFRQRSIRSATTTGQGKCMHVACVVSEVPVVKEAM